MLQPFSNRGGGNQSESLTCWKKAQSASTEQRRTLWAGSRRSLQTKNPIKGHKVILIEAEGLAVVTQIVGHWDETEAGDVSVVAGLVQLFLGRIVTGESLCGFWTVTISMAVRHLQAHRLPQVCVYSPTCGGLKGFSFSCFSNSAREVLVISSWRREDAGEKTFHLHLWAATIQIQLKRIMYLERLSGSHQLCVQKPGHREIDE